MAFAQLTSSGFRAGASLPFLTPFTLETFLNPWTSQQIQDSLNLTKASKVKALLVSAFEIGGTSVPFGTPVSERLK